MPTRIDTTFSVEGNFSAPVKISLPPHMVPGEKYPMIVYVYGGPGSQMVDNRYLTIFSNSMTLISLSLNLGGA